jgi:glycosyltransferase involved in cell wall biosynthesis
VDDGSFDLTGQVAKHYGAAVIVLSKNYGKGYALRKAFERAQGDIIVTFDADGTYNPREISSLIIPVMSNRADLVLGSRFLPKSRIEPHAIGTARLLGNSLFSVLVSYVLHTRILDPLTGFRAIRKSMLTHLDLTSMGEEINVEMTVKAIGRGFRYVEIPITSQTRYKSKELGFENGFSILQHLARWSVSLS